MAEQAAQGAAPQRADEQRRPGPREQTEGRCSGGAPEGGERRARAPIGHRRAANAIRQNGPRVGGNKEANARARSPERGREPSAAWWSRREWHGRGTCRQEPLEWRARDVSVPLPSPAPDPFPAHRVRSGTASVIRAGPALRRGHSQPGRPLGPGLRRPCSRDPRRRHRPAATAEQPPPPRGGHRGSGARTEHACAGREGERARCSFGCTPPFSRSSRAVAAALHWGTEGAGREWAGPDARHKRLSRQEGL